MKYLATLLLLLGCLELRAVNATNLLTYQAVSGTNATIAYDPNTEVITAAPLTLKPQTFLIQHAGVLSTNTLLVNIQLSFDNTNFYTASTYRTTVTNAGLYTFTPRIATNRFYIRAQVVTTNSTTVGVTATEP